MGPIKENHHSAPVHLFDTQEYFVSQEGEFTSRAIERMQSTPKFYQLKSIELLISLAFFYNETTKKKQR